MASPHRAVGIHSYQASGPNTTSDQPSQHHTDDPPVRFTSTLSPAYHNLSAAVNAAHDAWDVEIKIRLTNGETYTEETRATDAALKDACDQALTILCGSEPGGDAVLLLGHLLKLRRGAEQTRDNLVAAWNLGDDETCAVWWKGKWWYIAETENDWGTDWSR